MHVIIVEDDHNQAAWIQARIKERFSEAVIRRVRTEHEFMVLLPSLAEMRPSIVIMDVMLRWTDPAPGQPPRPDEVKDGGPFKAGLRCQKLLSRTPGCSDVPVVLYTVLEEKDLRNDMRQLAGPFIHIRKDSDPDPLLDQVARLTRKRL